MPIFAINTDFPRHVGAWKAPLYAASFPGEQDTRPIGWTAIPPHLSTRRRQLSVTEGGYGIMNEAGCNNR